jgi:NADH:ubiquinone oxidoreductase subunit 6 (subunit J)
VLDLVLFTFIAVTLAPAMLMFLEKKPIRVGIYMAVSVFGGALLLAYIGQSVIALLQLFVFSGCLSLYLTVSASSGDAPSTALSGTRFVLAAVFFAAAFCLPFILSSIGSAQPAVVNDFIAAAAGSLEGGYALVYAAVFLVFASAIGAVIVTKRFSRVAV